MDWRSSLCKYSSIFVRDASLLTKFVKPPQYFSPSSRIYSHCPDEVLEPLGSA